MTSGPNPTEQDPKQSIPDSQSGTRMLSIKHAQLLAQGDIFKNKIASRTEKRAAEKEKTCEISYRGKGFISYLPRFDAVHKYLILHNYEALATHSRRRLFSS